MYDTDLIYSWTPKEFNNFIKGARLRRIDEFELSAANALFTASAQNTKKKKLSLKDLYDAEKARKELDGDSSSKKQPVDLTRYRKAQAAMKAYRPQNISLEKGG